MVRARKVLRQRRGLRMHVRQLRDDDVTAIGDLRLTSPAQTCLDLAARVIIELWPVTRVGAPRRAAATR